VEYKQNVKREMTPEEQEEIHEVLKLEVSNLLLQFLQYAASEATDHLDDYSVCRNFVESQNIMDLKLLKATIFDNDAVHKLTEHISSLDLSKDTILVMNGVDDPSVIDFASLEVVLKAAGKKAPVLCVAPGMTLSTLSLSDAKVIMEGIISQETMLEKEAEIVVKENKAGGWAIDELKNKAAGGIGG